MPTSDHSVGLSAAATARHVEARDFTAEDMIATSVERAGDVRYSSGQLNIILGTAGGAAVREAVATDAGRGTATRNFLLAGVPVALKDNIATRSMPTTCGSRILAGYVSPYEATAVTRLRDHGAIVIARTNMDEFAMGSSTENSAYGPTRNPVDPTRVPGGSSGGSAAAVAAGIVPVALGSETGGSVRQPAAFCGVVGIKPTYGRVSRRGLVAFASSLDQIGILARTVEDAAITLRAVAGRDAWDSTSADVAVPDYASLLAPDIPCPLDGITVGIPREYFPDDLDAGVRARCDAGIAKLAELGATIRDVSLPHTSLAIPVYYIIAPAEASSNLARFDGVRYGIRVDEGRGLRAMYEDTRSTGFGAEVTRRIMLGTYVLSAGYYEAYYRKAQAVRTLIAEDFRAVFATGVDVLFTPTTPTPAFELGAVKNPYEMYLSDVFTATANLAGVPAMSLPIGTVRDLPVGGQLIANHFEEHRMLLVASALERALAAEGGR